MSSGPTRHRIALATSASRRLIPQAIQRTTVFMPEQPSRFDVALYDQDEDHRIPDWGGDQLFTRMPSRPAVDDAPPPRFRPSLALVDPPVERRRRPRNAESSLPGDSEDFDAAMASIVARAERLGLSVVAERPLAPPPEGDDDRSRASAEAPATVRPWGGSSDAEPAGRATRVITGRPDGAPRPMRYAPERRRTARTPSEWVGLRPERIVAWAFVLGLLLILIAISTADAATL
jgi:hypothetical protein